MFEKFIQLFFPRFLFISFCCFSVSSYFANAVTGCYNLTFFTLFNVVHNSLYWYINTIFNVHLFFLYFLGQYRLPMSSLGCKALCIVIIFFLSFGPFFVFSPYSFKNGPKYLTDQVFVPLIRFLLQSLVSRNFLVLLSYPFIISSNFISAFWGCLLPIFWNAYNFPSFQVFWCFLDLAVQFLPLFLFSTFHYQHGKLF